MFEPALAQGFEAHPAVGGLEGDVRVLPEFAIKVGDVALRWLMLGSSFVARWER
jgi:hypothetical protein